MSNSHQDESHPFLWGAATSAFQIEGHVRNDMTDWEEAGRFKQDGKDPRYENAVDHWLKWETDLELLKNLGVNAYRFSMEWARIQPQQDIFDTKALDQYERMVDRLLEMGITPMLTLHHFTHPVWFHQHSPWHTAKSIETFSSFVDKIAWVFSDRVRLFNTFNEPLVWLLAAYGDGCFPPGHKDLNMLMTALNNMLLAHRHAYDILKKYNPNAEIGLVSNFIVFRPERIWHLLDHGVYSLIHSFYNMMLINAFKDNRLRVHLPFLLHFDSKIDLENKIDFWGVNYYYRLHVRFRMNRQNPFQLRFLHRSGEGMSDLNWEIYARGLGEVLDWLKETNKPVYITENGIADSSDQKRMQFLKAHLLVVETYLKNNYPLKGYFHWSLMDNYEWLEGRQASFGLYEIDYQDSKKRKLRPSGKFYRKYIQLTSNKFI